MMNIQQKRDLLMSLPLMEQEQRWIMERLDTLSVKEQYQLSAAILRTGKLEELAGKTGWELETAILHMDPEVAVDAVNCLLSLEDYQICFPAGSYAQLGSFYLRHESHLPERAMYYADLEALGCYRAPSIRSDNSALVAARDARNRYVNLSVTYTFGSTSEVLDGETIHQWLVSESEAGLFGGTGGGVAPSAGLLRHDRPA